LPKSSWPLPDQYFILQSKKYGYEEALKKINSDFDLAIVARGTYENLMRELNGKLDQITKKLDSNFSGIGELVGN